MKKYIFKIILVFAGLSILQGGVQGQKKEGGRTIDADLKRFTSNTATELIKGTNAAHIKQISDPHLKELAGSLLRGEYDTQYRVANYDAFLSPSALGDELKIGQGYSKYEHVTGIYLPKGEHLIIVDNLADDREVELWIPNWNRRAPEGVEPTKDPNGWGVHKSVFTLQNGPNHIDVTEWDGLAYLSYYSDTPETENAISIHFVNGKVNGYFDITKHDNNFWNTLIDEAVYTILDARGRHIQIAYPVESLKKYAYNRGVDLISNYDSLVYRQYRFMGLEKYDRIPENRILSRVNYNYYMFRDGDGVAYNGTQPGYAMGMVADPDRVIKGDPCWGFSHEVGHVHQLGPYFHWGGLGEVSNNVYTLYVTTSFGNPSRINEQDNYTKARESIIDNEISYLQDPDVFNRLVPFWQLHLYFSRNGYPDFYADLHEVFRNQEPVQGSRRGLNTAELVNYQLNFVKQACLVSKTDLSDFFRQWGFFYVGDFEVDDYGQFSYRMTQEMVDEAFSEIKSMGFSAPKVDVTLIRD